MTKADIVDKVAAGTGLTKLETEAIIAGFLKTVIEALKEGKGIEIRGFGSYRVKKKNARQARNPKTGESAFVPEHYVPTFKFSKDFKNLVNNGMLEKNRRWLIVKLCAKCGFKIEGEYKFCPNCGSQMNSEMQSPGETTQKFEELLICKNCGEENPIDNSTCFSCGVPLSGNKNKRHLSAVVEWSRLLCRSPGSIRCRTRALAFWPTCA